MWSRATASPGPGSPSIGYEKDRSLLIPFARAGARRLAAARTTAVARPRCPECLGRASWQKLANQIHAPVYCPGWLPDPLTGQIGGRLEHHPLGRPRPQLPDRLRLAGDAAQEIHINLRGYPGVTKVPTCIEPQLVERQDGTSRGCPASPTRTARRRSAACTVTEYTVNQDADHVARPLRVALPRLAVHAERAHRRRR